MDKITDHLFIFEGDGIIKDFWGTYSEYKEFVQNEKNREKDDKKNKNKPAQASIDLWSVKKKLSYIEKRELEKLAKDVAKLEKQKDEINRIFDRDDIPYDDLKLLSEELGKITKQLEQKEYRRFELMERE